MSPIRTLLVDDSPEFLDSAARFLAADPQIGIIGRALSGREAIEQVARLQPDLVLMDVGMPGMNGLEATGCICKQPHAPRVVILTLYDNSEYRMAAKESGAAGYVVKSEFGTELLPLIHLLFSNVESGTTGEMPA